MVFSERPKAASASGTGCAPFWPGAAEPWARWRCGTATATGSTPRGGWRSPTASIPGSRITTSDPIGPLAAVGASVHGFATFCDDNGWTPVFYSVHENLRPLFESMGWATMAVAEETIVRPARWSMRGKAWQDVRSSINRAARLGVRAEWTSYRALPLATTPQIQSISESWVAEKHLPELGFTLGGLDELRDPEVALLLAIGGDDTVQAVTSWMPIRRDGAIIGWTLDFMRRRPDSMNGVMEFLIAEAALRMRQHDSEIHEACPPRRWPPRRCRRPGGPAPATPSSRACSSPSTASPRCSLSSTSSNRSSHPLIIAYPDPLSALPAIGVASCGLPACRSRCARAPASSGASDDPGRIRLTPASRCYPGTVLFGLLLLSCRDES